MSAQHESLGNAPTATHLAQSHACVGCGAVPDADAKFCGLCGTPVITLQRGPAAPTVPDAACLRCDETNAAGSKFCRGCGAALGAAGEPEGVKGAPSPQHPLGAAEAPSGPRTRSRPNGVGAETSWLRRRADIKLVVLAVVVLAAGAAGAAIALVARGARGASPASHAVAQSPAGTHKGRLIAYDASAKTLARTAETAAETIATDNEGRYDAVTPETIHETEPSIAICPAAGATSCLSGAAGTESSYTVTAMTVPSGNEFTVERTSEGEVRRTCVVKPPEESGCTNGTW